MKLMTFKSFLDLLFKNNTVNFNQFGKKRSYSSLNAAQYQIEVNRIRNWLSSKNLEAKQHVCTLFENSIEWNVCDTAIMAHGGIHVSLSPTTQWEKIHAILEACKIDYVIVGNTLIRDLFSTKIDTVTFYTYEEVTSDSGFDEHAEDLPLQSSSLASLFFTSGTTSSTKAVYHSHQSILENAQQTAAFYNIVSTDIALSFLPIHYAFERMYNYVYQFSGVRIVYANPSKSLMGNILEFQPNVFCIVPNLLEDLIKTDNDKLSEFVAYVREKEPLIICSGAAIPTSMYTRLSKLNINIYEMYGSTETLILSANSKTEHRANTAGKLIFEDRIQINESNQLLVDLNDSHYHPNFSTSDNLTDGWYNTKDIVEVNDGFLQIKGREDNAFKNKAGLFQNAIEIESILKQSEIVKNALVFYESDWGICGVFELEDEVKTKQIVTLLRSYNQKRPKAEHIKKYVVSDIWSEQSGEFTISFKVKRNFIIQKYKNQLIEVN